MKVNKKNAAGLAGVTVLPSVLAGQGHSRGFPIITGSSQLADLL